MNQTIRNKQPIGRLPLDLGWQGGFLSIKLTGGPFDKYSPGVNGDVGICVRAERVPGTADYILPIKDFEVPGSNQLDEVEYVLERALDAALSGKKVWVGCMGGIGRTGLFLALLAKVCGHENPVMYVRSHYSAHAVETREQFEYVARFNVKPLQSWLFWRGWGERWTRAIFWWR